MDGLALFVLKGMILLKKDAITFIKRVLVYKPALLIVFESFLDVILEKKAHNTHSEFQKYFQMATVFLLYRFFY